jgi:hypothetical protein
MILLYVLIALAVLAVLGIGVACVAYFVTGLTKLLEAWRSGKGQL